MKRFFAVLLCLMTLLTLAACAAEPVETTAPPATEPTETEATEPVDTFDYPEIADKLTWEKINSFPIKHSNMTEQEMRKLCVDFFRFSKTAVWVPDGDYKFIKNNKGTVDEMKKGTVYGGLPYIGVASGSVYRLMDFINEETGVVDISEAGKVPTLFGNQCSIGSYWGWGRVINSAEHDWTQNMVVSKGFLRVGPYTYDDSKDSFNDVDTTTDVCEKNGKQVMFQSYAQLQPADGLVYYRTAGHVIMCASVAHVEYVNGTDEIDGAKSYITLIDQAQSWKEMTNSSGDTFRYKNNVDIKRTFNELYESAYLPFTFAEFLGTDPVEETECSFSFTGDTITVKELFNAKVTANYGISDVYAIVKNAEGKEVYRHAVRAKKAGLKELVVSKNDCVYTWGKLDVSGGDYTVEIVCQLSTGERPSIYTGKLVP